MLDTMNHGGPYRDAGYSAVGYVHRLEQSHLQGAVYQGIYGREMFETWYKMAALIQSGLDLSRSLPTAFIDEFQQGFDAMRSGQSGK
jgi:threonine 3-dehydrogenase